MNPKDISINDTSFQKLLHDELYYRTIFKKTEKIVSVVFYILNNIASDKKSETHISNIAGKAHFTHELALRSLEAKRANANEILEQFVQSLIALDSTLRIAATSGVITAEVMQVVTGEIDTVLRGLGTYLNADSSINMLLADEPTSTPRRQTTERAPRPTRSTGNQNAQAASTPAATPSASMSIDRRTRIATILEAKGESTIKDISEIITDVSEKTIQRELNAMIEEGQVQRQGERRWSKYSLN